MQRCKTIFKIIKLTLDKLKSQSNNYNEWLIISFCLKDLFDIKIFIRKGTQINKVKHIYYILEHKTFINKLNNSF